jgi:Ras-related protein Rab-5C
MESRLIDGKVVLLGATAVGKTAMVNCVLGNAFDPEHDPTVGSQYATKKFVTEVGTVTLRIWDTAGQERYRTLAPMYYQGCQVAIVVFALTDPASFEAADAWVTELTKHIQNMPLLILVGNKTDEGNRVISADLACEYATGIGAVYFETSAKTGENIVALFETAAKSLAARAPVPSPAEPVRRERRCC